MNLHCHFHRIGLLVLVFFLLARCVEAAEGKGVDPREFGAKGDGVAVDTAGIQAAVDACAKAGGGTVSLRGGVFLSGTIRLKSNVTLHVEAGATLRGSSRIEDYASITPEIKYLYRERFTKSLIYAEKQENIGLTGRGTIDGQGKLFKAQKGDDGGRPYLIRFSECVNVQVRDLTLRDSARWLSHYLACENVTIDGVTIHSRIRENRDGIDIDSCDRVRISNCDIFTGDDAIVLKATAMRPCRRVAVTNCTLSSTASALKLGTESQGGFADITFNNCVIHDTPGTAICLGEVDGGACERINVSNIVMKDVGVAIFVRLGNRATPLPGAEKPGVGTMRDITISNIQAAGVGKTGCSVTGIPGHPVENVTLQNIRLRCVGGGTAKDAAKAVAEKEAGYPNGSLFGTLPAYGFFCRHVSGLRLQNVDLAFEAEEERPAIVVEDAAELDLSSLRAQLGAKAEAMVRLVDVRGALIHGCAAGGEIQSFLSVAGARTARVVVKGNDFRQARRGVVKGEGVGAERVEEEGK